jgi:hypothetical protein
MSQFQPPFQSGTYPQRPAKKKPGPISMAIAMGVVILAVLSCGICGIVFFAQANGTPAVQPTQAIAQHSTPTTTPRPTEKPTPKPTARPTPHPTPRPTQSPLRPTPTPKPCQSPCNPWGYNFSPGSLIYNPPSNFCGYFNCIASFWNGRGFVNECYDGSYSKSGGIRGDCSSHDGEWRPLYAH